jgi:hypothetical protein
MGLKLTLQSPVAYVRAVSGLFITKDHPSGLTSKEVRIIAKLMEHSTKGVITFAARKKTMEELGFKRQNFYNAMTVLKSKGVMVDEEMHRIFTSHILTINYANNS